MKKLNIGCGVDIREGWINLDASPLPGVQVVHDISSLPLPFSEAEFDEIHCQDVLEHVEYIPILRDIHRILKPGGLLVVRVPHFTSRNNFVDPTHKKLFSIDTFEFFVSENAPHLRHIEQTRSYYFDFAFAKTLSRRISFERGGKAFYLNRILENRINRSSSAQALYESTGLSRLFPAENVCITLQK